MTVTNFARQQAITSIGNEMQYLAVGTGSQTLSESMTTLTGSEFLRVAITGSADYSTPRTVVINANLNSVQASGLILTQFGNFAQSGINLGSAYQVNQLNGSLVCDGTIELSFESSLRVI
jgi:hypothetical protein